MKTFDCIVIGGGPAGLSAAIYMARFNRTVLVIDAGEGRTTSAQINENYLGFPHGIPARKLSKLGKEQAQHFGAKFVADEVIKASKGPQGKGFTIKGKKGTYKSKTVIMCTGVKDTYPAFPGLFQYIGKSLFWCIICDGYKTRGKRLVIVGHDDKAVATASQFINFTRKITFLTNCDEGSDHISKKGFGVLKKAKIPVVYGSIKKIHGTHGMMEKVELDNGKILEVDFMFNKQGYTPNSTLAAQLGAVIEGEGFIKVEEEQKTTVPYLYAAGDVTSDSAHQIATAVHQGSVAATSANEDLLMPFQREG